MFEEVVFQFLLFLLFVMLYINVQVTFFVYSLNSYNILSKHKTATNYFFRNLSLLRCCFLYLFRFFQFSQLSWNFRFGCSHSPSVSLFLSHRYILMKVFAGCIKLNHCSVKFIWRHFGAWQSQVDSAHGHGHRNICTSIVKQKKRNCKREQSVCYTYI